MTHSKWQRAYRERARAALAKDPSIRPHGNVTTYQTWGCRCDECRKVASANRRRFAPYFGRPIVVRKRWPKPFGREWLND